MKKVIVSMAFIMASMFAVAQTKKPNVTKDAQGNYVAIAKKKNTSDSCSCKETGKTYTDKYGKVFPVYVSEHGKLFIFRVSRETGNIYKYYLQTN
jgi:hypothetical protein